MHTKSLSYVWLLSTPWTVACQSPLSKRFFRQEHQSGLPCPPPGDLSNPENEPASLCLLHWQVSSSPLAWPGKPSLYIWGPKNTQRNKKKKQQIKKNWVQVIQCCIKDSNSGSADSEAPTATRTETSTLLSTRDVQTAQLTPIHLWGWSNLVYRS